MQDGADCLGGKALDKEGQEAWKELDTARQERERPAKRFGLLKAGNLRLRERGARNDKVSQAEFLQHSV